MTTTEFRAALGELGMTRRGFAASLDGPEREASKMTSAEFRAVLKELGHSLRSFARYVGANERTVRRWALGEQDIPAWVPVLIALMQRLAA